MGIFISKIFSSIIKSNKNCRILMLGLDAAGKTTILYKLRLGEVISSVPTIGFNVETVHYKNLSFQVWDIGGQNKIRELWSHYYANTDALIYVIDSSDYERYEEAKETLHGVLNSELRDVPVLIYANKQDLGGSSKAIAEKLGLDTKRGLKWKVQGTCAITGDGLYDGLEWLSKELPKK